MKNQATRASHCGFSNDTACYLSDTLEKAFERIAFETGEASNFPRTVKLSEDVVCQTGHESHDAEGNILIDDGDREIGVSADRALISRTTLKRRHPDHLIPSTRKTPAMDPKDPNFIRHDGPDSTGYRLLTRETITALDNLRRVLQIIVGSLMMGVASFGGYILFTGEGPWTLFGAERMDIMLGMAVVCAVASLIVPSLLPRAPTTTSQGQPSLPLLTGDPDHDHAIMAAQYMQLKTIVGCALLEGGAFANLAALMMNDDLVHALAAGLLLMGIGMRFPTRSRYLRRIEYAVEEARLEQPLSK